MDVKRRGGEAEDWRARLGCGGGTAAREGGGEDLFAGGFFEAEEDACG